MKTRHIRILALAGVASLFVSPGFAGDSATPERPARETRMATCSHEAKEQGLKGEERQAFMSKCLKAGNGAQPTARSKDKDGDGKADHLAGQQNKMKTCNAEAGKKDLRGEERKKFMSTCLKG